MWHVPDGWTKKNVRSGGDRRRRGRRYVRSSRRNSGVLRRGVVSRRRNCWLNVRST